MNLQEETRNGYTISADMKAVWAIQMTMIEKLLSVCKKHGLKIWAEGGTLLGTVREHGYIPWDDDIDMVMLRDDYDRLLAIAPHEFEEPFFFQNAYTDRLYMRGHSQLRYNGTAAILPADVNCQFNQSIFIDIFVYDALPKDKSCLFHRMKKAERLRTIMQRRAYARYSLKYPRWTLECLFARLYFLFHGFRETFAKFDGLYSNYVGEVSDVYSCPAFLVDQLFCIQRKKEWYAETIEMPFEDIMLPVPAGYHEILVNQYGENYMTPMKAPTMHGNVLFDTHRSYKEVLKDIKAGKIDIYNR